MPKQVIFAGAGPGAIDLITLRGLDAIKNAGVIIYAGSLVNPELLDNAKPGAEIFNSAEMSHEEVIEIMEKSVKAGKQVLRLHTGDPSIYGAIAEQMRDLDRREIDYEVIPGVSSAFAAAAELNLEMTIPGITQTAIFTRRSGRTPVPEQENLKNLAANDATLAIFLSIADMDGLVSDLIFAGRSPDSPAAVVYRASWPNRKIVRGTLNDIAEKVRQAGITRQAMIITGEALSGQGDKSRLYAGDFAHGYRNPQMGAFTGKTAVYGITEKGTHKAAEIAAGLKDSALFIPEKFSAGFANAEICGTGEFAKTVEKNWTGFDGHIFVMACGIVVRHIAPLIRHKLTDPAVVVCDENGANIISLLSGHVGGGNRLSRIIAGITGGKAVITTATDVNGLTAFDEIAARKGWRIENPAKIKVLNTMLLEGKNIDLLLPEEIFNEFYSGIPNLKLVKPGEQLSGDGAVLLNAEINTDIPCLNLEAKPVAVGIGCRKDTVCKDIEEAVLSVLAEASLNIEHVKKLGSIDAKQYEPGLLEFAKKHNLEIEFYSPEILNSVKCPNISPVAEREFGVKAVAEAAALAGSGAECLLLEKRKFPRVTAAVAKYVKGGR